MSSEPKSTFSYRKTSIRCADCKMPVKLCLCELFQPIHTQSKLSLVIQKREVIKPTNTGLMATKLLSNSEYFVRGEMNHPLDYPGMMEDTYDNLLLFPSHDSIPLTPELVSQSSKPVKLFVADGTWGQAHKIYRRIRRFAGIQSVHVPKIRETEYRLRRPHPQQGALSTIEAIADAFEILEGKEVKDHLLHVFNTMVERTLWMRGCLSKDAAAASLPAHT